MGANSVPSRIEDNRAGKQRVIGVQAGFISGRKPSGPNASTVLVDSPGNHRIERRGTERNPILLSSR